MNAEILSVGTELLMGQIANTNAQFISQKLQEIGIGVYYHSVVGDNEGRLKKSIKSSLERSDIIIMTGGLGPTKDDITKETAASVLKRKLIIDEETLEKIKEFFHGLNKKMSKNNIKQAYMPEGSFIVRNKNGTAPGFIIEQDGKTLILLPGPPGELYPMFMDKVYPYLEKKTAQKLVSKYVRIFGIGESSMEELIMDLIDKQSNPTIAPYAKEGEVTLRITAKCSKHEDGEKLLKPVVAEITRRLGIMVYSTDNSSMEAVAGRLLIEKGITFSIAESCTGGVLSSRLTDTPGISSVYKGAIISYSNEMKHEFLNVDKDVLSKYGAVSEEAAKQMAVGIREITKSDIGISITGIAGPDGGTDEKPVGLVFISLADKDGPVCKRLNLWGDRRKIRNMTSLHALDLIRRYALKQLIA